MQTWSGPNTQQKTSPARKLAMYTLLFFSLAGLIAGFSFGGFQHAKNTQTGNTPPSKQNSPVAQVTIGISPTPTLQPVTPLNFPEFMNGPTSNESAANNTVYSLGMQVVDKDKKPVHATDITCKAWLVKHIPTGKSLNIDGKLLKDVGSLTGAIAGTVDNTPYQEVSGLTFSTPQAGFCDKNGQMTWKYTVSPSLAKGTYDVLILADWRGIHWNWSWANIDILAA